MADTGMSGIPLLLLLFLAHVLGDFILQRAAWVDERYEKHYRSKRLYAHAVIHAVLPLAVLWWLFGPSWKVLGIAALIGTTHFVIDLLKSYTPPGRMSWFVIDQLLHLLVLGLAWLWATDQWSLLADLRTLATNEDVLLVLIGYVVVIWPFSIVIELICRTWAKDTLDIGSLANAGKRIGQLERFLVLTFILVDQFAAIGFLLAAKSILRFGDTKEANHRKINEYILVGTMTSFAITIAFGLVIRALILAT